MLVVTVLSNTNRVWAVPAADGHSRLRSKVDSFIKRMKRKAHFCQEYHVCRNVCLVKESKSPETRVRKQTDPLLSARSIFLTTAPSVLRTSHERMRKTSQRTSKSGLTVCGRRYDLTSLTRLTPCSSSAFYPLLSWCAMLAESRIVPPLGCSTSSWTSRLNSHTSACV